jgi:hypothetical protein
MIIDNFITPLGFVELSIDFNSESNPVKLSSESSQILQTENLSIEIIAFDDISAWTKKSRYPVEETKGWIVRITKRTEISEQVTIYCELKTTDLAITSEPDSGESLDAVWIENKTHFLSIGTEDGERLRFRAEKNDYLPIRFQKQLGYQSEYVSFTEYLPLGFRTIVPELRKDEKLYFHYLMATNPKKKSLEYPDEDDISTNFAVNFPNGHL